MGRSPCCEKVGLKKGPWSPEEDHKLLSYIEQQGHGSWRALPAKAGLQRCGKSCRLRWTNYLRPDIKRGKFSLHEEQTIIQLHALLGNRWSAIATHLPKRTDNEIKNYWNTHLKKRLVKMGIDPVTHKPKTHALSSSGAHYSKDAANLSHMAQWETARLEAESRLARGGSSSSFKPVMPSSNLHYYSFPTHQLGSSLAQLLLNRTNTVAMPLPPQANTVHCLDILRACSIPPMLENTNSSSVFSVPVGLGETMLGGNDSSVFYDDHTMRGMWIGAAGNEGISVPNLDSMTDSAMDHCGDWTAVHRGVGGSCEEMGMSCGIEESIFNVEHFLEK